MGLFGKKNRILALIDIGSSSIAGGYASIAPDGSPHIHYATRIPIEVHDREVAPIDMLKTLGALSTRLLQEGAPALRKAVGSGSIDSVVAAIGSPWQETRIRAEFIDKKGKPFTFTKTLLAEIVANKEAVSEGRIPSGELVIATLLNGYETKNPFGKKAERAELVILSSTIEAKVAASIREEITKLYHTKDVRLTAFAPVSYTVLRDLYPHEKDFLVLHASGEATDLALIKRGLLVDVASIPFGFNSVRREAATGAPVSMDTDSAARTKWISALADCLRSFSDKHALPRTVFLLADEQMREYLGNLLNDHALHSLWLSDEPLTIIPSVPQHLSKAVTCDQGCEKDLFLSMLALSAETHPGA